MSEVGLLPVALALLGGNDELRRSLEDGLYGKARLAAHFPRLVDAPVDLSTYGAELVFIDHDQDPGEALMLSRRLADGARLPVVLLSRKLDAEVLRAAMRTGAKDLVAPDDIRRLKELVAQVRRGAAGQAELLAVLGCRGGVGVTTVAVSLAQLLSTGTARVVMVDMDQHGTDLLSALDMEGRYTTHDLLLQVDNLDREAIRGALARRDNGFWVLPQPAESVDSVTLAEDDVRVLLAALRPAFDLVIVDMGALLAEQGREICASAGHVVLVANQEIPALRTAVRRLKILKALGLESNQVHLVLNRYNARKRPTREEVEQQLNFPVFATLSDDYEAVVGAQDKGRSVVEAAPRSVVSRDLEDLAALLQGERPQARRRGWWLLG